MLESNSHPLAWNSKYTKTNTLNTQTSAHDHARTHPTRVCVNALVLITHLKRALGCAQWFMVSICNV